jgi:hypothetical protein
MPDEEWLSFRDAADLVRQRFGTSIGRSEALVRQALACDEVRKRRVAVTIDLNNDDSIYLTHDDGMTSDPVYLTHDDGLMAFDKTPGALNSRGLNLSSAGQWTETQRHLSKDDLLDWLGRQDGLNRQAPAQQEPGAEKRSQPRRGPAMEAIEGLRANGTDVSKLSDKRVHQLGCKWLRSKGRSEEPSEDTFARALGRKK